MKLKLVVVIFLSLEVLGTKEQERLFNHIFENYDPRIRPVRNDNDAINVTVKLTLYQLIEIAGEYKVSHSSEFPSWDDQITVVMIMIIFVLFVSH